MLPHLNTLGPYSEDVLHDLSKALDVQILIYSDVSHRLIRRYPTHFDDTRHAVFLLAEKSSGKVDHLHAITNIGAFFRKHGHSCFFCESVTKSKSYRHLCRKRTSCFACKRYMQHDCTKVPSGTEELYCDSQVSEDKLPEADQACKRCNVICFTKSCFDFHKRTSCGRAWYCHKCNTYSYINGSGPIKSHKIAKETHRCDFKICRYCQDQIEKTKEHEHLCRLSNVNYQKEWDHLGFLAFEVMSHTTANCLTCFEQKSCSLGSECEEEFPSVAALFLEKKEKRGDFQRHIFADSRLTVSPADQPDSDSTIVLDYVPQKDANVFATKPVKIVKRKKTAKVVKCANYIQKLTREGADVVEKCLVKIIESASSSTTPITILTHGGSSGDLFHVLNAIIKNGILPNVVKKDAKLLCVDLSDVGVRFIDCNNYLNEEMRSLQSKFDLPTSFFPETWNRPSNFDYSGAPPKESDFFNFLDTQEVVDAKKDFVRLLKTSHPKWTLKKELVNSCCEKAKTIAFAAIDYIRRSFRLQDQLTYYLDFRLCPEPTTYELHHYHPFTQPLMSQPTFSFNLFMLHTANVMRDLRVVKRTESGIHQMCSIGEQEWTSYLHHSRGRPEPWYSTFSNPRGQIKIGKKVNFPELLTFEIVT